MNKNDEIFFLFFTLKISSLFHQCNTNGDILKNAGDQTALVPCQQGTEAVWLPTFL